MALPDIASLVRARASLLWIETTEEARVERYIFETLQPFGYEVFIWDCADGVVDHAGKEVSPGKTAANPDKVLQTIQADSRTAVWVMRDLHRWLSSPVTIRRLRSVAKAIRAGKKIIIVIVPPGAELPADLKNEVVVVEWSLPDREEVGALLDASAERVAASQDARAPAVAAAIRESVRNGRREQLVDAALGMSGEQAAAAFALSLVATKVLDRGRVLAEKKRVVAAVSGLTWTDADPRGLDAVGGNEGLKDWLRQRRSAFGPKAREFGLPAPRGCLLLGPPGTGKSLSAKAVSSAWGVPLLRLDLGSAKSKYVGESEGNIRQALKVAATVAPCVLWVDEIEKALGGSTGPQGDGGVASDALGTLLTFLQENDAGCFLLATANDVTTLPPELLRKGRFDQMFFLDLPDATDRVDIFKVCLARRKQNLVPTSAMINATDGFSGAELQAVVDDGLFTAFADGCRALMEADVLAAIASTVPLSRSAAEKLSALREWAKGRCRLAGRTRTEDAGSRFASINMD